MSEYLTRLATRARESDERQLLRPFVRSLSPIAAHDQRIGMAVSEGFETVGAPPDQSSSEAAAGSVGELETGSLPGIEPRNRTAETTVQRKMAAPATGQAGAAAHTAPVGPPAARGWTSSGLDTPTLEIPGRPTSPSLGMVEVKSRILEPAKSGAAAARGAADQHESDEPLVLRDTTLIERSLSYPKTNAGDGEPSPSSLERARLDTRPPDSLETRAATRQVSVHTRSVRQQIEVDSPRLEPKTPAAVEHFESSNAEAAATSAATSQSPRIVIGRIDVEVVPPPASERVATAPRPKPLTAASVSVIGPLTGVRPNLRLSLRYR
jgi:hypothetical protein